MSTYLVETHLPKGRRVAREITQAGEADAAAVLRAEGIVVRFNHSILVPEDELCFYVVEAPSGRDAARAAQLAGLDPLRVVEALASEPGRNRSSSVNAETGAQATHGPLPQERP